MKTEKIIWGLILVFVGGILLLQNFGVIDFYWRVIFRFWPLILILIGANMLFSYGDSNAGAVASVLIALCALCFIAYKGITTSERSESHWSYDFDDYDDSQHHNNERNNTFSELYKPEIHSAVLNISGGATEYILKDTTSHLFEAGVRNSFGNYSLSSTSKDTSTVLNFTMKSKSNWNPNNNKGNRASLRLNTRPVWDINIEMGAGTTRFDLSPFKIHNLNIQGGAASFKMKLGNPVETTRVSIETGVSDIEISIPSSAACKINSDSGLSSNNFEGFTKQEDGTYITSNYKESSKKIELNLQGGLSKFDVSRY